VSPCRYVKLPQGGFALVRYAPSRPKKCRWCAYHGSRLCDFPVGDGKTCDAPMCGKHARRIDDKTDYCPDHAEAADGRTR
jgi:hypothetical protein